MQLDQTSSIKLPREENKGWALHSPQESIHRSCKALQNLEVAEWVNVK